jgi:hypothetical protein
MTYFSYFDLNFIRFFKTGNVVSSDASTINDVFPAPICFFPVPKRFRTHPERGF